MPRLNVTPADRCTRKKVDRGSFFWLENCKSRQLLAEHLSEKTVLLMHIAVKRKGSFQVKIFIRFENNQKLNQDSSCVLKLTVLLIFKKTITENCTSRFDGFEAVHLVAIVCNGKLLKVGGRHELKVESWKFERELKVGSRSCSCSKVKEHWSFSL